MELEMIIKFVFFIYNSTWVQPVRALYPVALMKVQTGEEYDVKLRSLFTSVNRSFHSYRLIIMEIPK